MKTPDEVKKGLECCSIDPYHCGMNCPYAMDCHQIGTVKTLEKDALAYIHKLERERDVAVEDLHRVARDGQICAICKYEGGSCDERQFAEMECWQWRGVQKEVE